MEIKDLLGNLYKEGMTDEEIQQTFASNFVAKNVHDSAIQKMKNTNDSLSSENAEYKRKAREQMSESERLAQERADADKAKDERISALERQLEVNKFKENYISQGFDAELALETANAAADGDFETVNSNFGIFLAQHDTAQKRAWEKQYNLNPPAGNGTQQVDYSAQISEALGRGDQLLAASLMRKQAESNS